MDTHDASPSLYQAWWDNVLIQDIMYRTIPFIRVPRSCRKISFCIHLTYRSLKFKKILYWLTFFDQLIPIFWRFFTCNSPSVIMAIQGTWTTKQLVVELCISERKRLPFGLQQVSNRTSQNQRLLSKYITKRNKKLKPANHYPEILNREICSKCH